MSFEKMMREREQKKDFEEKMTGIIIAATDISIPKDIFWTKEDWKDLYETLAAFKKRIVARHSLREEV
jgi:hypothetical protein